MLFPASIPHSHFLRLSPLHHYRLSSLYFLPFTFIFSLDSWSPASQCPKPLPAAPCPALSSYFLFSLFLIATLKAYFLFLMPAVGLCSLYGFCHKSYTICLLLPTATLHITPHTETPLPCAMVSDQCTS